MQAGNQDERIMIALMRIRGLMQAFMDDWRKEHPAKVLTRVQEISAKRVGTQADQQLKLKAGETWTFLNFLLKLLRSHKNHIDEEDCDRAVSSGELMVKFLEIVKGAGSGSVSEQQRQESGGGKWWKVGLGVFILFHLL